MERRLRGYRSTGTKSNSLLKTVLGSGGRFSHRCRISSSQLSQASEHGIVVVGAAVVAASLLTFFVSQLVKKSHPETLRSLVVERFEVVVEVEKLVVFFDF